MTKDPEQIYLVDYLATLAEKFPVQEVPMKPKIDGITLKMTCYACPEQYDAYLGDRRVGYLRLRHGVFTVECPDVGGKLVYDTVNIDGDGCFYDDVERNEQLLKAVAAIKGWIDAEQG